MFSDNGFKVLKGLHEALVERQGLLSNNLANIDTEGFVRKDIDFGRVLGDLKNNSSFNKTNDSAIASGMYNDPNKKVTLESEMSELYSNHVRLQLMIKTVSRHFENMKKALEVRGG